MTEESSRVGLSLPKSIDYTELEAQLQHDIEADKLYWLQNDAKLRAVTQGTPSYESFRQMVLGAHLQPMKKEDKLDFQQKISGRKVIWNSQAGNCKGDDKMRLNEECQKGRLDQQTKEDYTCPPIRTSTDLLKTWKDVEGSLPRQWNLLRLMLRTKRSDNFVETARTWDSINAFVETNEPIDANLLTTLWQQDIPLDLFPGSISLLLQVIDINAEKYRKDILCLLEQVTSCRRYRLMLSFMTKEERKNLAKLLKRLNDTTFEFLEAQKNMDLIRQIEKELQQDKF